MASNRTSNLVKGTNPLQVILNIQQNKQMHISMSHSPSSWCSGFSNLVCVILRMEVGPLGSVSDLCQLPARCRNSSCFKKNVYNHLEKH